MWLFKDGRLIKVRILDYGGYYKASASYKGCTVWNCDGTTREQAKEMALFRLKKALAEVLSSKKKLFLVEKIKVSL